MSDAILVSQFGGPDVMRLTDIDPGEPGPGEVRIKHEAIGLNFIDVYQRSGLYKLDLPFVPGNEGAGVVTDIGAEVEGIRLGDRVCYAGGSGGGYAEDRLISADQVLPIPANISFEMAAAVTLKGLTVYYLLEMTHRVTHQDTILFHAAAGGVGQLAVQWAKARGATVIGTVGSPEKAKIAKDLGCDAVIDLREEDFVVRVQELTKGKGVDVVYDSIGRDTFVRSLSCLRPRGLMVSFGNSSGPVSIKNLGILASKGSLYVTRPTMADYYPDRQSRADAISVVFNKILTGQIKVDIGQTFGLREAAKAHQALEGRETTGSTVLVPGKENDKNGD